MSKQIEEMAKDVSRSICWCNEEIPAVDCLGTAAVLYGKGYRKQSEGEWISVDERLPHWSDGKVLVFTQYGFSICERTVNGRWRGQHANWITHWMPLPQLPKMKGGE